MNRWFRLSSERVRDAGRRRDRNRDRDTADLGRNRAFLVSVKA